MPSALPSHLKPHPHPQKSPQEEVVANPVPPSPNSKIYNYSAVRLTSHSIVPSTFSHLITNRHRANKAPTTELAQESTLQSLSTLRQARKQDLHLQKQALEDLAPRAEPGTKARQLEKKADLRFSNNQFAVSKSDNTFVEIPEVELMGGDDDDGEGGIEGFKKKKAEEERKKNDREVRREEILRARREEREERMRAYREKEERTMEGLVALARARFG